MGIENFFKVAQKSLEYQEFPMHFAGCRQVAYRSFVHTILGFEPFQAVCAGEEVSQSATEDASNAGV